MIIIVIRTIHRTDDDINAFDVSLVHGKCLFAEWPIHKAGALRNTTEMAVSHYEISCV